MPFIKFVIIIIIFSTIFISSCSDDSSLSGRITGTWKMTKVLDRSEDVTKSHNPEDNRWIRFIKDEKMDNRGIFESGHGNIKENTGKWSINGFELFIDSDAGDSDDSYWQVIIKNDEMHWVGQRFDFNKRFEIFFKKTN